ncbi:MAG: PCRF domain-containing protein, partial [Bacteroidetes bacterium]|nr:PCRF domain-containing protein [Bacteroidota bacterium]
MNLIEKLEKIKEKYELINKQLSDPGILNDREKMISLGKERSELEEIVKVYENYSVILKNIEGNNELVHAETDKELIELAEEELTDLEEKKEKLEKQIKIILLPKDPNDNKDVIVEIRAGTGGKEAALFADDLFRMYSRYAEIRGWKLEMIDLNETGLGGIKE